MAQPEKSNEGGENPVGDRIRQARQDAKLSLDAIGKELGVTGSAVSQWESGRTWPTWARLVRFAKLTGVTIQWLLVGEGDDGLGYRPMTIPRVTPTEAIDPKLDRSAIKKVGRPLEDFVIPNFPCSTSALAVPVFDLRNAPLYELCDIVLIDPEVRPVPGDMVLAAIDPDPVAVFAKYVLGRSLRSQDAQLARAQYHEAKANMQNKPEFMQ